MWWRLVVQYYREKLKAEVEGREWKAPKKPAARPPSGRPNNSKSTSNMAKTMSVPDDWGWDEEETTSSQARHIPARAAPVCDGGIGLCDGRMVGMSPWEEGG